MYVMLYKFRLGPGNDSSYTHPHMFPISAVQILLHLSEVFSTFHIPYKE